jgi:hypothetical protein
VILFGPESLQRAPVLHLGWGWVADMSGRIAGRAHPREKSAPDLQIQAYIAYHLIRLIFKEVNLQGSEASPLRKLSS